MWIVPTLDPCKDCGARFSTRQKVLAIEVVLAISRGGQPPSEPLPLSMKLFGE